MQVIVQTIDQVKNNPSPPFADIISCYIQDAFQGIPNLETPQNQGVINFITDFCKLFVTTKDDINVKEVLKQNIGSKKIF